jgi:hypothetical protein
VLRPCRVDLGPNENAKKHHEQVQASYEQHNSIDQLDAKVKPEESKPKHMCMHCDGVFIQRSAMVQHMQKNHAGLFFVCKHSSKCTQIFRTEAEKSEHLIGLKNKVKLKKCNVCHIMLSSAWAFFKHMQIYHKDDNLLRCSYNMCPTFFRSEGEKQIHETLVHATAEKRKCLFCHLFFIDGSMLKHFQSKHKSLIPSAFKCKYRCSRYFLTEAERKEHIASVHENYPVRSEATCLYCNKICSDKYVLNTHIIYHHSVVKIRCKFYGCYQYFHTQPQADTHFEQQHQKIEASKKFQCSNCNYRSADKGFLEQHISRTHGDKILPCPNCSKRFSTSYNLRLHVKLVHTFLRECPHCKNSYLRIRFHLRQEKCKTCQKVLLCVRSAQLHKKVCNLKSNLKIRDKVFASIVDALSLPEMYELV